MKTAIAIVVWVVELGLSLALIVVALIGLSFVSEGRKGHILPLHQTLNILALLLAALPLGMVLWVGYRTFVSDRPNVPLGLGLPVVAGLGCALASLLVMTLGERFSNVGAEAEARRFKAEVRERVEAGEERLACQVMVTDPDATAQDMRRCRAYVESRPRGLERWYEFDQFLEGRTSDLKTWNPQERGLSPFWDKQVALAVVHHDQAWFLRAFFESLLEKPPPLYHTDVSIIHSALAHLDPASGWSREAIEQLRPQVLPELLKRITPEPGNEVYVAQVDRDGALQLLNKLLESGPREVPPVPPLASPPTAETVGVVRMDADGALEFWMRATATQGNLGDVYFRHASGSESHQQWIQALGPMVKGQVRPVPRLKAP